jgi:hypothetical protein
LKLGEFVAVVEVFIIMGGKKQVVEPRHPTVAVSDSFMAASAWYAAMSASSEVSRLGFMMMGTACCCGVMRFGFFPEVFRPYNEVFAKAAGQIGLPLVGFGFLNKATVAAAAAAVSLSSTTFMFTLLMLFCAFLPQKEDVAELYTKVCGVATMACIFTSNPSYTLHDMYSSREKWGVILFTLGGIVIGNDRERCLFGVRRENLFHYTLAIAIYLFTTGARCSENNGSCVAVWF